MADTKLSALTAVAASADADLFYTDQGGVSKKATRAQVLGIAGQAGLLQVGTGGTGLTSSLQRVYDGSGNASALQLATGNVQLTLGNVAGIPSFQGGPLNPGGILGTRSDAALQSLIGLDGSNNVVLDPQNDSAAFVKIGQNHNTGQPSLFINSLAKLQCESADFSQDTELVQNDASNNVWFGLKNFGGGASLMADTYFSLNTGKTFHWNYHGSGSDAMSLTASRLDVFGGSGGNGFSCQLSNGNLEVQGNLVADGGSVGLSGGFGSGFKQVATGVVQMLISAAAGGWLQNTGGTARVTSAVTNATTTLSSGALSDLTLTLIVGRKYVGRLVLFVNNSTAAEGFKLDLNGGSATMTSVEFGIASALGATVGTRTSAAPGTAVSLSALADTSDVIVEIPVTIVCNQAGTVVPRFAENSHSSGTATVQAGSYFLLDDSPN